MTLRDFVVFWVGIVAGSGITGLLAILTIGRVYRDNQKPTIGGLRGEAN